MLEGVLLKIKEKDYNKMSDEEKEKIKGIIRQIVKNYDFVESVIIFGSFVNRNYFRDVDIAIIGEAKEREIRKIETQIEKKIGLDVDVKSFEELPLTFKFSIFKYGKLVFAKNKKHDFIKVCCPLILHCLLLFLSLLERSLDKYRDLW